MMLVFRDRSQLCCLALLLHTIVYLKSELSLQNMANAVWLSVRRKWMCPTIQAIMSVVLQMKEFKAANLVTCNRLSASPALVSEQMAALRQVPTNFLSSGAARFIVSFPLGTGSLQAAAGARSGGVLVGEERIFTGQAADPSSGSAFKLVHACSPCQICVSKLRAEQFVSAYNDARILFNRQRRCRWPSRNATKALAVCQVSRIYILLLSLGTVVCSIKQTKVIMPPQKYPHCYLQLQYESQPPLHKFV